jgi:S-adenosylmethionine hydrolase
MNIISLLTDFGEQDNFVGVMKGVILKINPQAKIIDLCHNVKPQDINEAAFLLLNSYKYFPKDTVHLVVVDPGVGSKRKRLLVKTKDYLFVGPDNGVLSLALKGEVIQGIVQITNEDFFLKPVSDTFHGRDIFSPVVAYLSLGRRIDDFGKRIKTIKQLSVPEPRKLKNKLIGKVIYIDHFGNLVTNISRQDFIGWIKDSHFKICIASEVIKKISHSYQEGKKFKPLAIFNSFGNLEISVKEDSAQRFFSVNKRMAIKIIKI